MEWKKPSEVFARQLRALRRARGLSQSQLAALMREAGRPLSYTAILRIETGERGISLDEALALAYVLKGAPAHMLTPENESLVALTERSAVDGEGMQNFLVYGEPLGLTYEGRRDAARKDFERVVLALARAITDAERGGNDAGKRQAIKAMAYAVRQGYPRRVEEITEIAFKEGEFTPDEGDSPTRGNE